MTHVEEINDLERLAEYAPAWQALLAETAEASFFQSLDWLTAYWRHFGHDQRLRILAVAGPNGPLGIVPLVVRREATRLGTVRVLTYPLCDWGSFYGPIGPQPEQTLLAAMAHVAQSKVDWDMIDLRWVNPAIDGNATLAALTASGFRVTSSIWAQSAQVELTGDWATYLASRKPSMREKIRYAEKRLERRGTVTLLRWRPAPAENGSVDPRWDLYDECEELARRSWQGSSRTGTTLSHSNVRAFLRDAHAVAARDGAAEINLLQVDGQGVAFAYNYCWNGYIFGLRTGYDADFASEGAGTVLLARMIRDSFARGDRIVDLGAEYLECKRHWWTRLAPACHYTYFRPGAPKAQALRFKRWLVGIGHRRELNTP